MPRISADRRRARTVVERPGMASPLALTLARRVLLPIVRLAFRPTLEGTENLPPGPFLLVANHSGGLGAAELNSLIALYAERFGLSRPLAAFAFAGTFDVWPLRPVLVHVGAIPSTYEAAERTLAAGVPILVFPGGDYEALRPIWQHDRVDFGARRGFLRIARKAWVPIVPMGIRGSHFTAPVLFRARWLATASIWLRFVGAKRWALTALGLFGAVAAMLWLPIAWPWRALAAWAWIVSPFSMVPWVPWRIRMRIGPPIPPEDLFADPRGSADADELITALRTVERGVHALQRGA